MKKLFITMGLCMLVAPLEGYEFAASTLRSPIGKAAPKQVLVHRKPAAVVFVNTSIFPLVDIGSSTVEQISTNKGYVMYVAPNSKFTSLWLTAPGFFPKEVGLGSLPAGSVWELTVSSYGKSPKKFNLSKAQLSFVPDPTNASAAVSQTGAPEIWVYTDAFLEQLFPLFKEGKYMIVRSEAPPYRIVPRKKKSRVEDVLSPVALNQLGNIAKMPLEEKTVYNLNIYW